MKTVNSVGEVINFLTKDEDLRQELWVHYLMGNDVDSFSSHLKKINLDYSEDLELKKAIWALMKNPPSQSLMKIIDRFSEFEKSIISLIMIGVSIEQIAEYKNLDKVRVRQAVSSIRNNSQFYGISTEILSNSSVVADSDIF